MPQTTTQNATSSATANATPTVTPNLYNLSGHQLHVTYATTSITGVPRMTYQDPQQSLAFQGDEIRTVKSDLGTIVSVTLRAMPDVGFTTLSVLIPRIEIRPLSSTPVRTDCITTVHSTPFVVPGTVLGQLDHYTVTKLRGTAHDVRF